MGLIPFVISKYHEFADSLAGGCKLKNVSLGHIGHSIPKRVDYFRLFGKSSELINGNNQLQDKYYEMNLEISHNVTRKKT